MDDIMLGYMKISIFLAASFVVAVQGLLDTYGPSLAAPKTKYTVCISTSILTMTVTLSVMPFNHSFTAIVIFGTLFSLPGRGNARGNSLNVPTHKLLTEDRADEKSVIFS